jgi:hypothetical protein
VYVDPSGHAITFTVVVDILSQFRSEFEIKDWGLLGTAYSCICLLAPNCHMETAGVPLVGAFYPTDDAVSIRAIWNDPDYVIQASINSAFSLGHPDLIVPDLVVPANPTLHLERDASGETLYRFSNRDGSFTYGPREGEAAPSFARVADFDSPAQAFETVTRFSPGPQHMYQVTNVGTLRLNGYYPVYDSLQTGNPFGHVSVYGNQWGDPFKRVFIPFGPPEPVVP